VFPWSYSHTIQKISHCQQHPEFIMILLDLLNVEILALELLAGDEALL